MSSVFAAEPLAADFASPPDNDRPGVYWYFMDGNLSRTGMTHDLESMREAGIGRVLFLEVNVGVPKGPIHFMSEPWQELVTHAIHETDRLGMEFILGTGPGWCGSGGPWVKPEQSMQHLVATPVQVEGPGPCAVVLPVSPPAKPYFRAVPQVLQAAWSSWYRDVAVLAYPKPANPATIAGIAEKALYIRDPYTSKKGVKPNLLLPAIFPADPPDSTIPQDCIVDLTDRLRPDGTLDWQVPKGKWIILRLVARNNGMTTRPAPDPGIGFECDKFDSAAIDAHLAAFIDPLLAKVGPRQPGRGWTMLHIDSWEMGAQNYSPVLRDEFRRRRGYDPQPFFPTYLGQVVGSQALSERFLWDLRLTGDELINRNHGERIKTIGRQHGLGLSIEPYDLHPGNDVDFGAIADVPMCEFWSVGFNASFSVLQASSIAHIMGRAVVGAEAFTGGAGEAWKKHPGALKNQGDWAFAAGVNRFIYHTFAHKPNDDRPGMQMGPYGVHWDRGQTWWPMVDAYHRYVTRCSFLLRQGRTEADILYLMPEGAPNVFTPPASAVVGLQDLPDRRGYYFDGCSAALLMQLATVQDGRITFPSGASYRVLVLPQRSTMTPALAAKLKDLITAGAIVQGLAPRASPSLSGYPACDQQVQDLANELWGETASATTPMVRKVGKGRVHAGDGVVDGPELYPSYDRTAAILTSLRVAEDLSSAKPLRYTHRTTPEREIYFVSNPTGEPLTTTATFRVNGRSAEWWDPLTGLIRRLPINPGAANTTTITLSFPASGSGLVVFPVAGAESILVHEPPLMTTVVPVVLDGAWDVTFDPTLGGPVSLHFAALDDWSKRPEPGVRYYSGIATYHRTFTVPVSYKPGDRLLLDLGRVEVMARVRVNGTLCSTCWTAPWQVDIGMATKAGENALSIEVANLWSNRMIGDAIDPAHAISRTTYRPYKATSPLQPSGLLGPVTLRVEGH